MHQLVREPVHAALRMLDDGDLAGAQKLGGYHDAAEGVRRGAAGLYQVRKLVNSSPSTIVFILYSKGHRAGDRQTYIPDDVRLANADTERLGRVDAGVHAGDEDKVVGRRRGQAPVLEAGGVALRGGGDVLPEGRHSGGWSIGRQRVNNVEE